MATIGLMISTTPMGRALLAEPYTLERAQPNEKRMIEKRARDSNVYINIMNVTTTTPQRVTTSRTASSRRGVRAALGGVADSDVRAPTC